MPVQGTFVEFIDHGKFISAFVLEDNGKRLRLLNQHGREMNIPLSRIIHHCPAPPVGGQSRIEVLKALKETDEKRQSLAASVDLAAIWEIASEEAADLFDVRFLAELCFGQEATEDQVAAFLRAVFADRLFFKYKEGKLAAHSPEVVEQLRLREEKERQRQSLLDEGAKALTAIWHGEEVREWRERELCLELVREYYLKGSDAAESGLARELLKQAQLTRPHDAFHLLVKAGVWDRNENIPLLRHELPSIFSAEVLQEADVAGPGLDRLLEQGRKDLTGLPLLTIDGESTRDFDDALHLERRGENYLVGIHVSDVAHYVKPGSLLFKEAVNRVTSIYFPDALVPMLPRTLSEGACSLIEGRIRPAMSFMVLLSPSAEVLDFDIVASVVKVKRQLSYTTAEKMMNSDTELRTLAMLSQKLKQRRIEAGALLLPIPDVNIAIGQDEQISVSLADVDTIARSLVSEFMVLANTIGAQFVAEREVPGLFRSQEQPHQRLITGVQKDLYLNFRQRKQLKPGQLLTVAKAHSGVGVAQYTTVTSPIRRLLDLVMQHQIHGLLRGAGAVFSGDDLREMIAVITTTTSRVNQVRQLRHRYWLLKYLAPKAGSRVNALILNKGPRRVNVVLVDCLLETDLPPSQGVAAKPGDIVPVCLARVKPLDNVLRLEW